MFTAFGPRGSAWTSKLTFWPSTSGGIPERSTAEIWTKTSLEPSSGAMKPKPLVVLKNFTVPVIMCESSFELQRIRVPGISARTGCRIGHVGKNPKLGRQPGGENGGI